MVITQRVSLTVETANPLGWVQAFARADDAELIIKDFLLPGRIDRNLIPLPRHLKRLLFIGSNGNHCFHFKKDMQLFHKNIILRKALGSDHATFLVFQGYSTSCSA